MRSIPFLATAEMLSVSMVMCAAMAFADTGSVDFRKEIGKVRRELHSSGFGPMICSCSPEAIAAVKEMNFLKARTHDWALINPGERVCDYYHIFPLMHLDPKEARNYWFGPTDYLLKRTREETKLDIFYRLGTSIEHSGDKVHFNTLIPEDFEKVAETFAGTIRHYNKGWANGFNWNIRYWEIWNEPDGCNNMWCEPGGDAGKDKIRREKFVKFFVTVLKRLKKEFPEVKVGGPAMCWMNKSYFSDILKACQAAGVAPDFISWHYYGNKPEEMVQAAASARKLCDSFGFTDCELILNEWHYLGCTWGELRSTDPKVQARVWEGPASHNGIDSSAFVLSALAQFQTSALDEAYYYGCRHNGSWGYKDVRERKYKTFYALKLFGRLVNDYTVLCASSTSQKGVTTLAVKNGDGSKAALLVADYRSGAKELVFDVQGLVGAKLGKVTLLDDAHNLTETAATFAEGKLTFPKADAGSVAILVEFER